MGCCCCCKIFAVSARIVAFHYQLRSWFGAFVDKFTEEHCIVKHCNALHCGVPVHCGKHCIVDQWAVERMQCVFWSTSALWSRVRRTGTENWNQIYLGLESNIFGGGYASFYDTEIFTHIKVMQFRYNAVQRDGSGWQSGGPGAVGGRACGAIRGHRTASLLYFVFCIYVKFRKKHVHKLAHFYNEEGIDSKGDKSKMMNFHQPVISSAASSWRSLLKDQHHCLQVIHNIISICWYILRLPQGEVKGKYWYILVNIGKYW